MKFPFKDHIRRALAGSKVKAIIEPGTDAPYPPRIERTRTDDVTEKEKLEARTEKVAKELRINHPLIGADDVSLTMSHGAYGDYQHTVSFKNPVLKQGTVHVFWRYPDVHDIKWREAVIKTQGDGERLKQKNIEMYKEFVTRCLRATYLPENLEQRAEETKIPPAKLRAAYEKDQGLQEIDWEKEARNAVIIKVSQRIPEVKTDEIGKQKEIKAEPSFQVIEDQAEGIELFHPAKTLSELISEHNIQTDERMNEQKKTALVLKEFTKKYNDKTTIILLRDETDKGWEAEKTAGNLGIEKIHPIFDYEAYKKAEAIRKETRPLRIKASVKKAAAYAAAGLTALVLFAGADYGARKFASYQSAKVEETIDAAAEAERKPSVSDTIRKVFKKSPKRRVTRRPDAKPAARKPVSSNPYVKITPVYDAKKDRVYITVNAKDSDGIDKLVLYSLGYGDAEDGVKKLVKKELFSYEDGVKPAALRKKKQFGTEVTEEYDAATESWFWYKGKTYDIVVEATDKKGNKEKYNVSWKVPK